MLNIDIDQQAKNRHFPFSGLLSDRKNMSDQFAHRLRENAAIITAKLDKLLCDTALDGEIIRPPRLMAAVRHGVLNGGKRIRPFLMIETAALFGVASENVIRAACALECLHCYSLIHDDLPSMDDDDLRRGQPTVHKAFDEAMAVLAGDALLTFAFDIMSDPRTLDDAEGRMILVQLLAQAAGQGGMIGGQVLDIAAETKVLSVSEILQLQSMKTGALLQFACEAGAIIGNASAADRQNIASFGKIIGQAFQLADDLLDITSDSETMGKATGKDQAKGKKTLIDYLGIDGSRNRLRELLEESNQLLVPFGEKADILRQTAHFIIERKN